MMYYHNFKFFNTQHFVTAVLLNTTKMQ